MIRKVKLLLGILSILFLATFVVFAFEYKNGTENRNMAVVNVNKEIKIEPQPIPPEKENYKENYSERKMQVVNTSSSKEESFIIGREKIKPEPQPIPPEYENKVRKSQSRTLGCYYVVCYNLRPEILKEGNFTWKPFGENELLEYKGYFIRGNVRNVCYIYKNYTCEEDTVPETITNVRISPQKIILYPKQERKVNIKVELSQSDSGIVNIKCDSPINVRCIPENTVCLVLNKSFCISQLVLYAEKNAEPGTYLINYTIEYKGQYYNTSQELIIKEGRGSWFFR